MISSRSLPSEPFPQLVAAHPLWENTQMLHQWARLSYRKPQASGVENDETERRIGAGRSIARRDDE